FVPPQEGEFYDVVLFGEDRPVMEKTYRLTTVRAKPVQFAEYNGDLNDSVRFKGGHLVYTWTATDLAPVEDEPFSADRSDFLPKVVLSTLEDWPARARWFHETNEDQFAATEGIAATTREVIRGLSTDEDRFLALQQWVATHIRYSGLSMGEGEGYTLHPAEMIFTERSGVCKDIAGMLVAMLRSAGYETYPVMTMAGARVEDIPADQFNHCVVAVRRVDGSFLMLDPTWCAYSASHWSRAEGHQHYVIGSPEGGRLEQQPLFDEDNRITWRLECALSPHGDLSGIFRIAPSGNYDTAFRRQLAYRTPAEREALFAGYLRGLGPSVRIVGVTHSDPDDLWTPFSLELRFEAEGYAVGDAERMAFPSPLLAILTGGSKPFSLSRYTRQGPRKTPALIWSTRWEEGEEVLRLPSGWAVADFDTSTTSLSRGSISLSAQMRAGGRNVRTTITGRIGDRYLEPVEFAAVAEASAELDDLISTPMICRFSRRR
ncbi:MAG: transglutaminase-like domain-containing protein, partial [Candidatus Eisenbacteria bacterium]|nr:transglutaminase-like domain-containing protein [Candidatus Eisenbacteria bacterium]